MRRLPFLSFFLLLMVPLAGMGQTSKGTLTGRVTDNAGAVLQGAMIQILQLSASYVSDTQGEFVAPNLAPGSYEVRISFVGFAPFSTTVTIEAGKLL